ncbi:unnamed protein product [Spirodela intermedia]|uniref:Uncharacterized protein n=1 Tax=Spirodela intermedia TaxID=51605 RepID=A0A7I8JL40_SPIIN|nr:unnamed protein product [Spirodela intermedia]CAA6670896.1 unnamed protein product [Spirodela intermedia]
MGPQLTVLPHGIKRFWSSAPLKELHERFVEAVGRLGGADSK